MSSVAVLTQEIFNEHRSGLLPEQSKCVCVCVHFFDSIVFIFLMQLLWQEPLLGKRKMPFRLTRTPFHLCLRRQPHRREPRKLPMLGHLRFVPSSLLSSPRCAFLRNYILSLVMLIADVNSILIYLQALVGKCFYPESLDGQKAFSLLNTDRESLLTSWLRCGFGWSCQGRLPSTGA